MRLTLNKLYILILIQLIFTGVSANASNSINQLQEELKTAADPEKKADLLYEISNQLSNTNYDLSVKYAEDGLLIATKHQDKKNIAKMNKLLGSLRLEAGKKDEALEKFETAIRIATEEDFKDIEAMSVITLGYYWYRLGDSTKTISNYKKAYDLYTELGDKDGIAQASLKLGWGYDMFGNHEEAERFCLWNPR